MSDDRLTHWQNVYATKPDTEVSWFQEDPAPSLELVAATGISADADIIDVGGGASRLVDSLLERGFSRLTVLDISANALAQAQNRLGPRAAGVDWIAADIRSWEPSARFDLWHDRAALHFLTEPLDREAYIVRLMKAVRPLGHAIIATFAPDGPERCSGLPIMRYGPDELARTLGPGFDLVESRRHDHQTPGGATQRFQFSRFLRN